MLRRRSYPGSARLSTPSSLTMPGGRLDQPVDHPEQRRLAGARRADDGRHRARLDRQRHIVHHRRIAVALGEVFDLDHARATSGSLGEFDDGVEHDCRRESQRHGRHRAEQHQVHRRLADALENEDAKPAAADQRGDGGEPDILHQHDADAGQDDREGERKLDPEQPLAIGHAHAACRVVGRTRYAGQPHHRVGHHRQQRIEEQRDEGRRRADAADADRGAHRAR